METPFSTRRVTRSQTLADFSKKLEESEKKSKKSRGDKKEKNPSALTDITNDSSPIIGLAMGNLKTPSSSSSSSRTISKRKVYRRREHDMPGTGEALLRGQVKSLLQKVEEEEEKAKQIFKFSALEIKKHFFEYSPMAILAPTPSNTPQVLNLSADEIDSVSASPVQVVINKFQGKKGEGVETEKDLVTRSLFFEFFEKAEDCGHVPGGERKEKKISSNHDEKIADEFCEGFGKMNI